MKIFAVIHKSVKRQEKKMTLSSLILLKASFIDSSLCKGNSRRVSGKSKWNGVHIRHDNKESGFCFLKDGSGFLKRFF